MFLLCLAYSWQLLSLLILCQPCAAPMFESHIYNSSCDPYLLVTPLIRRSIVLPSAPGHIPARLCVQLESPEQPHMAEGPGISQGFRGDLEASRTVFPLTVSELTVLEISPASL